MVHSVLAMPGERIGRKGYVPAVLRGASTGIRTLLGIKPLQDLSIKLLQCLPDHTTNGGLDGSHCIELKPRFCRSY